MSVYKIVQIVGTSPKSWEDAARAALATIGKSLEDLRVAEVVRQDVAVEKGKITAFRVWLNSHSSTIRTSHRLRMLAIGKRGRQNIPLLLSFLRSFKIHLFPPDEVTSRNLPLPSKGKRCREQSW